MEIDAKKRVWYLKEMIAQKKPNTIKCDADKLKLYLAKKGEEWLKSTDPDVKQLKEGESPDGIKALMKKSGEMDPQWNMQNKTFGFPDVDAL